MIDYLLIGSLLLNFSLFFILLFSKNEENTACNDYNEESINYSYSYSERKLYINDVCHVTFRCGSSNHKVFEYLMENEEIFYIDADKELFPPNLDRSTKKTLYMLNLPKEIVRITSSSAVLLVDIKKI
ncbi:TPA: hypothetical protein ACX6O7_003600 [Photobacterium damselae]